MIEPIEHDEPLDEQYSGVWTHPTDGPASSVAEFLVNHPGASAGERLDVLLTDQLLRWRRGCPRFVGEYLEENPALAGDPEAILRMIQGEFLARLECDEVPEPASYMRMFPDLAEEIRLQCEVDQWLTVPSPTGQSMAATVDYSRKQTDAGDPAGGDDGWGPVARERPLDQDAPLREADFQLTRVLGSGGMGEVYEAIQKSLGKRVALKVIRREALDSPSRVRRFFAEARALARLGHAQIVGVHGIGRMVDGRYFLVMDLVEGGTTLSDLIKAGAVPFDRAAELVATVAEAIDHAHSRSVIHRDLKPSNVLLDSDGRPHVTDFGLAKVFDATDPNHPQTTADQVLGTPHYMAPEQADPARGPITPRTDVYALGGLLYSLLTGEPPIRGDSITALLAQVVSAVPVRSPRDLRVETPGALEQICRSCLQKDAENRYPSAGALAEGLRAWLANPDREETASVKAGSSKEGIAGTGRDPTTSGSRHEWVPDRSLKDERPPRNPGPWKPRATSASAPRSRRRLLLAGASVATLLLAFVLVVPRWGDLSDERAIMIKSLSAPPGLKPNTSTADGLYHQAETWMKSERRADWIVARDEYLDPLDSRFPDNPYGEQTRKWRDQILLSDAESRATILTSPIRTSASGLKNNAESQFVITNDLAAKASEQGDELAAMHQWQRLAGSLSRDDPDQRPWYLLALHRADQLNIRIVERRQFVTRQLQLAKEAIDKGRPNEATIIRKRIVEQYGKYTDITDLMSK